MKTENLLSKIEDLENRLAESEQWIDAIKSGEVDAFAVNRNNQSEIYTLESGDYAYRVLVEEFGEGALNMTEEGLIVYTNKSFFELLKTPYENVIGDSIFNFIHPLSTKKFNALFAAALKGESKGEVNIMFGERVIPVYISLTSLQPKLATVGMIVTDLSDKKKDELTIFNYQQNLEKANEALSNKNRSLEQKILNDFSESFAAYKTGQGFFNSLILEIADKTNLDYVMIGEVMDAAPGHYSIKTFAITASGNLSTNIEYDVCQGLESNIINGIPYTFSENSARLFPKNKTFAQYNIEGNMGYPLLNSRGKVIGLIAVMHKKPIRNLEYTQSLLKIAARRSEIELERIRNQQTLAGKNQELLRINEQLNDTKNFINNVLESTNHGVIAYMAVRKNDFVTDFEIRYINDIALNLLKLTTPEAIGKSYPAFFTISNAGSLFQCLSKVLKTRSSETHETNAVMYPDRWFMVHYEALEDSVTMTFVEITEQKKYARALQDKNIELERSNAELASFSYIASHDLQEPLRKIQTFAELILEKEFDNFQENTKDYFKRIISASSRMQHLIAGVLNYSRTSTVEIAYATTDLNMVAEEVVNNFRELIDEQKVSIETSVLPTVKVDPFQFAQLFSNIIGNSIKYRKPDTEPVIKISAKKIAGSDLKRLAVTADDQYWNITIRDNGIGFDQQYAGKIFELFQRLHGRSEYEGTGIGLAICKKIVQNHQGYITAEGEPGMGAAFHIYLPVR